MAIAELAPGSIFAGRYVVEQPIGGGGMGSVFAAQHTSTRRRVALKLMLPTLVAEPKLRERFAQEAQVSSLIQSKHVVEVIDAGVDVATGSPFIAMELLQGRDLAQLLRERGALPAEEVVRLLAQVARGLDRAHAAGIVHRDLKPENLFLCADEDGSPLVKILDFGIAKLLQGSGGVATMATGTPAYMAPEQLGAGPITPAADIWAFGLIAFTLLTGRTYWEADSIASLYNALMAPAYPSPLDRARALGMSLAPPFEGWFRRCTARDPAQRFASAGEACEQLRAALGLTPPTQSVPPPAPWPIATTNVYRPSYPPPNAPTPYVAQQPAWGAPPPPPPPPAAYPRATSTGGNGLVVALVAIGLGVVALGGLAGYLALRASSGAHERVAANEDEEERPTKKKAKPKSRPAAESDDDDKAEKASEGPRVDAPDSHLRATFPAGFPEPKHQVQPLPAVPGVDLEMWTAEARRGACLFGYIDYKSKKVFAGRTTQAAFDGARDGALANMGSTLEEERDFEYQGYPARVFTFQGVTMGKQIYGRQLLVLEGQHLYQVMFIGYTKGERDEDDIEAFFKALEIVP